VQIHVEPGDAQQPPDDGLAAGDDQFTAVPGLDFMGPGQHRQAGAVGKAEPGQIRHQGLRRAVQGIADGLPQVVRAADVKLALEPQQGPLVMMFGDDKEEVHLRCLRWAAT
jgi:hypothetical protein